jgi:hypothetical protein
LLVNVSGDDKLGLDQELAIFGGGGREGAGFSKEVIKKTNSNLSK